MAQQDPLEKLASLERPNKDLINIMPLQTGSVLTEAARRALVEFGDGYSVCDFCSGRLTDIVNPPVNAFVNDLLPPFLGCDRAILTYGARDGIFMVLHSLTKPGDVIVVDKNRHYSTAVAAERAGVTLVEVPHSGHPEYVVDAEGFKDAIAEHKPSLVLVTYPDGKFGNVPDAARIGEIAREARVPFLINGAYSVGRMPVKMRELNADFIVGSGHKSMASAGPSGVLGMSSQWTERVLRISATNKKKEVECLGCTLRGVPLVTLMASFPEVQERVKAWDVQVEKAQRFSTAMQQLGFEQLGEKPHRHDMLSFTSNVFYEISQKVRERGYFLYKELKERGIWGIQPGQTKTLKISTYAATDEQLEYVLQSFKDIIAKYS